MGAMAPRLGKKTGPKPSFNKYDLVKAAWRCGITSFTMSSLAKELGVTTPALYRVVTGRDAVIQEAIRQAAIAMYREPEGDARAILRQWADLVWELCAKNPGFSTVIWTQPPISLDSCEVVAPFVQALRAYGVSDSQAAFALDFLTDTVTSTHFAASRRGVPTAVAGGTDSAQPPAALNVKVEFILDGLERHWPEAAA